MAELAIQDRRATLFEMVQSRTDVFLAIAIVAILLFLIIPLPSFLIDILLAINITCSLMILLRTLFSIVSAIASLLPFRPLNLSAIAAAIPVFTIKSIGHTDTPEMRREAVGLAMQVVTEGDYKHVFFSCANEWRRSGAPQALDPFADWKPTPLSEVVPSP